MKIAANRIENFLGSPPSDIVVILIYGPDEGLVRERGLHLTSHHVADLKDPFSYCEILAPELSQNDNKLMDEALSISFNQTRRVVRVRQTGDSIHKSVTALLEYFDQHPGDLIPLVILEAGDLPPRSKLRTICEKNNLAAALPCYRDDQRNLNQLVRTHFSQNNLKVSSDIIEYTTSLLGSDRGVTRQELEKLSLYLSEKQDPITFEEIQACLGDSADIGLDDLCDAIGLGLLTRLDHILPKLSGTGITSIQQLRAVSRHFQRLNQVNAQIQTGIPQTQALKSLRPPLFFKKQTSFQQQLPLWPQSLLQKCLSRLIWAEDQTKSNGAPADLITSRVFLDICLQAYRQKRQNQSPR